jgi:hypothetical protein
LNPTNETLTDAGRQLLDALLADFEVKLSEAAIQEHLSQRVNLSRAILSGAFQVHPTGTDEENNRILAKAHAEAESLFERPSDQTVAPLPGADRSTWRVVFLTKDLAPDLIAIKRRIKRLEAERLQAIRAVFLDPRNVRR